jgi:hypothetical protein
MSEDATSRTLGPSTMATLMCRDAEAAVQAYVRHLYQEVASSGCLQPELAKLWNSPQLTGQRYWLLQNRLGNIWLRIIESPLANSDRPRCQTGWLSLEISVQGVDGLAASLADSPFTVLRPPANLELSDKIRATQVLGPGGEMLYLTEIKGPVPPFELTPAACPVDKLFIPVLCCRDRETSTVFYEKLSSQSGLRFDTKITVVNQILGQALERQYPVATVQLNGYSLIEIDQIDQAVTPPDQGGLPEGIAMISFETTALHRVDDETQPLYTARPALAPYHDRQVQYLRGAAGEAIELMLCP